MAWRRGQAYGQDLRDRVLAASGSMREVAERFEVSLSYVSKVRGRHRGWGETAARVQCSHTPHKLAGLEQQLRARVAEANDLTLEQLRDWLRAEHGLSVCHGTMFNALKRLGLKLKKSPSRPASSSTRP